MSVTVVELSAEALDGAAEDWEDLAGRAEQPLIFNSWHWCQAWWRCLRATDRASIRLRIFVAQDNDDRWIGVAPLFEQVIRRAGLRIRCLQFVGGAHGRHTIFRTEYNDLLLDSQHADEARAALYRAIGDSKGWQELVTADTCNASFPDGLSQSLGLSPRSLTNDRGYRANLTDKFSDYLSALRGSARRQLFNKRKRLAAAGSVAIEPVDRNNWSQFVSTLNAFHERRWGQKVLGPLRSRFVEMLLDNDAVSTPKQSSTVMTLDGVPLSALLDVDYRGRRYNLQAGITESAPSGISPGFLHFGYSIEQACEQELHAYEFLIGKGKNENYKQSIANEEIVATSWGFSRAPWLRALYHLNDTAKRALGR